jgi:hypothetical protein
MNSYRMAKVTMHVYTKKIILSIWSESGSWQNLALKVKAIVVSEECDVMTVWDAAPAEVNVLDWKPAQKYFSR